MLVYQADQPLGECETDSLRLWISDRQWMRMLQQIERDSQQYTEDDRRDPSDTRFGVSFRCVIRIGQGSDSAGIYLVRTRDLSAGGIGFMHSQSVPTKTRCTFALQSEDGRGRIVAGQVAWCRPLRHMQTDQPVYAVGLQFDKPIDVKPFVSQFAPKLR